jgi:DNA-binding transcriptional regulator LsrR (DeoR family)
MSLTNVAKKYHVSRASAVRFVQEAQRREIAIVQFDPTAAGERLASQCIA